jgi:hypothetical protein
MGASMQLPKDLPARYRYVLNWAQNLVRAVLGTDTTPTVEDLRALQGVFATFAADLARPTTVLEKLGRACLTGDRGAAAALSDHLREHPEDADRDVPAAFGEVWAVAGRPDGGPASVLGVYTDWRKAEAVRILYRALFETLDEPTDVTVAPQAINEPSPLDLIDRHQADMVAAAAGPRGLEVLTVIDRTARARFNEILRNLSRADPGTSHPAAEDAP